MQKARDRLFTKATKPPKARRKIRKNDGTEESCYSIATTVNPTTAGGQSELEQTNIKVDYAYT